MLAICFVSTECKYVHHTAEATLKADCRDARPGCGQPSDLAPRANPRKRSLLRKKTDGPMVLQPGRTRALNASRVTLHEI